MSKVFKTSLSPFNSLLRNITTPAMYRHCEVIARPLGAEATYRGVAIHKYYCVRILFIILLALPIGCSCFPDQSKAIGKEREWDKRTMALRKELSKHSKDIYGRLKDFQQKVPDLDEKELFKGNDMKGFLETMYPPYLSALQALEEHLAKHERDHAKKIEYTKAADYTSWCLRELPTWIRKNNTTSMYGLVLPEIKQAQDEALKEGLKKLQKDFPDLGKDKLFQGNDVKDLLQQRYIPYLYAVKAHATYFAAYGADKRKTEYQEKASFANNSMQEVSQWLQTDNKDNLYELIKGLIKK